MNVRKAQKHMQRARELLHRGQLEFGDDTDEVKNGKRHLAPTAKNSTPKRARPTVHELHSMQTRNIEERLPVYEIKANENNPFTHATFECAICLSKKNINQHV